MQLEAAQVLLLLPFLKSLRAHATNAIFKVDKKNVLMKFKHALQRENYNHRSDHDPFLHTFPLATTAAQRTGTVKLPIVQTHI